MESLYRKYRPQTFADVVGQQHVVSTLEHAVLEGRISHAYLFCGPRGTGKTTMARILAKALICERGAGHLPDGSCEQCRLIAAGEHPDVLELDAASRTGVDNVREEIINRVAFAPVRGRYKAYVIDEVHMLTTAAFNALLKTLEEPPPHVVFVLCTTDPQKVPETILSRVQRFDFRPIGHDAILAHLKEVCGSEGFDYDEAALDLVVRHARGGMRDALSTLEQLSTFGGGNVSLDAARDLLGEVTTSQLVELSCAIARRDVPGIFDKVSRLVDDGRDLLQFSRELAAHLRDVYVVSVAGPDALALDLDDEGRAQRSDEALAFGSPDRVAHALAVLNDASNEMRVATNQRLTLEVALTRIARPRADLTLEALADQLAQLEGTVVALSARLRGQPCRRWTRHTPRSHRSEPGPGRSRARGPQRGRGNRSAHATRASEAAACGQPRSSPRRRCRQT
ncbi:DNA polymerase III subunit gamma/tau [Olsenella massiliensis]|uniref:DNA polymerase III subunit gamma/tau n=1 Tax=Olsenella massiliensis TaxID=1622075 RepID=UPI000B1D0380|nr:DNA polymerase III subunit gamma/tau [Olsenella massiliensis]